MAEGLGMGYTAIFYEIIKREGTLDKMMTLAKIMYRDRFFSFYNSALAYLQKPGALYICTETQWAHKGRYLKQNATPIVCLVPNGPVEIYYDLSDTYGDSTIYDDVIDWSETIVASKDTGYLYDHFKAVVSKLRIVYCENNVGLIRGGESRTLKKPDFIVVGRGKNEKIIPRLHTIMVNSEFSDVHKACTIIHELGHILCGHLPIEGKYKNMYEKDLFYPVFAYDESPECDNENSDGKMPLTDEQKKEKNERILAKRELQAELVCKYVYNILGYEYDSSKYLRDYGISDNIDELDEYEKIMVWKAAALIIKTIKKTELSSILKKSLSETQEEQKAENGNDSTDE